MEPHGLVGRDAEVEHVAALLAVARPVVVIGEAGIGKTSLVRAAAQAAELALHEGGGLETLAWTPLLALRRAVGDGLEGDVTAVVIEVERRVGPDVLFIDDLQWTDVETRSVLGLLAGRVALVVTIRTNDTDAAMAADLLRVAGAEIVELGGVDRAAAIAIVERARPLIDPALAEAVVAEAGGNPLLLEELTKRGRPTSSLARALAARITRLSPAARHSLDLLAVAGRGLPESALGSGADELVATGVALRSESEIVPRHGLLAEAAITAMSEKERRRCHGLLAGLVTEPGERARHLAGAGRRAEAARFAQIAADQASMRTERATHLELVAQMTDGPAGDLARLAAARPLVEIAGSASARAIDLLAGIDTGTAELMVERDALLVRACWDAGDLAGSRAACTRGREWVVPATSPALALLDVEEAVLATNVDGDTARALQVLDAAEAAGRGTPRSRSLRAVIRAFADGIDTLDELRRAHLMQASDPVGSNAMFGIEKNLVSVALVMRGFEAAHGFLVEATALLDSRGMPARADDLRAEDVQLLVFAGRLADAALLADELLERPLAQRARQWTTTAGALASAWHGRAEEARQALDAIEPSMTSDYQGHGEYLAVRAQVELLGGRPGAVAIAYEAHLQIPAPTPANRVFPRLAAQWAADDLGGDPGPSIKRQPWPILGGAAPESEGIVALHAGDFRLAARCFRAAANAWVGFHAPREVWCRWAHGEALRRAGAPAAIASLRDAVDRAEAMGLEPVARRARRSLRQVGVHVAAPRPEQASDRSARMTNRERQALELVGRGLVTPEIARRMGLGRGTVDQVLRAAARKLDAVSRVHAAAILERDEGASVRPPRTTLVVRDEVDAPTAVLAALEGAEVAIDPTADPALADRVHDDLRRLGRDAATQPKMPATPALGSDELHLLARIAEGMTLGEAARWLHMSRRTADRRLVAARRALGVATTAEALVALQRRGLGRPD